VRQGQQWLAEASHRCDPAECPEKSWHEGADLESDGDPLSLCRTVKSSRCRLWFTECEKAFPFQSCKGYLEIVGSNRKESVCTLAAATPDPFNERMIRGSALEMNELAHILRRLVDAHDTKDLLLVPDSVEQTNRISPPPTRCDSPVDLPPKQNPPSYKAPRCATNQS
jgi:hypothetical protein